MLNDGDKIPSEQPLYMCPACKAVIDDIDGRKEGSTVLREYISCDCGAEWKNCFKYFTTILISHGYCTDEVPCPECLTAEAEHRNDTREDR